MCCFRRNNGEILKSKIITSWDYSSYNRTVVKKYSNADSDPVNGFAAPWKEFFENGWFGIIEKQIDGKTKGTYEDGDAYIGLIGGSGTAENPLEYWIGMFMPENTVVPEGFGYIDFPKGELGICWVYGKQKELYGNYGQCVEKLNEEGFGELLPWCIERYACPRFTTPDEKGNVILDIGFFIKQEEKGN